MSLAVLLAAVLCAPSLAAAVTGVERLSVNAEGLQVPGSSFAPYISADGGIVAFTSYADLTGIGATTRGVYVRDTVTGQMTRIAEGTVVGLSSDGRYLAAADSNELGFHVYDLQTGAAAAILVPSGFGNRALSYGASLSANGRYLVFGATTPDSGESSAGHEHIIVYDLTTGTEEQIPDPGTNWEWPTISNSGRFVAFQPALAFHPVEVLDRSTGQIVFDPTGYFTDNYQLPRISPDGTRVLFSAMPAQPETYVDHVYVGGLGTGLVTDLTPSETGPRGALANGNWDPTSRYVSFSAIGAVLPFATNGKRDVYVYDTFSGSLTLASITSAGAQGDNDSGAPYGNYGYATSALSENATSVVFQSSAANLVPDDGAGIGETETPPGGGAPINRTDIYESFLSGEMLTGPPLISGQLYVGQTLKTTNGTWTGLPASYTYQWEDCNSSGGSCVNIADATSNEYTLTSADIEHTIRVVVTATSGSGSIAAESAATAVVAASLGVVVGGVVVEGIVPFTQTLATTCSPVVLGPFVPGKTQEYNTTCGLKATSTAAESKLAAEDASATDTGHLVQLYTHGGFKETYDLPESLEANAISTQGGTGNVLTSLVTPVTLLTYARPFSEDEVTVKFNQKIGLHDHLHTGTYAKTITLTLSTTTP